MQKYLVLRCSRNAALAVVTITIVLFILIGCQALFRSAGLTDEQAAAQTAELKAALEGAATDAIADIHTGLAEGHDLKTIAVKASSAFLWKMIAAAGATVGVVLNGLLAKWLSTEKKMNKAIITGVESNPTGNVKESIEAKAIALGVETKLHARVKALTKNGHDRIR
ncbi:hypothetical protein ES703_55767 [subsurface metagenome]